MLFWLAALAMTFPWWLGSGRVGCPTHLARPLLLQPYLGDYLFMLNRKIRPKKKEGRPRGLGKRAMRGIERDGMKPTIGQSHEIAHPEPHGYTR